MIGIMIDSNGDPGRLGLESSESQGFKLTGAGPPAPGSLACRPGPGWPGHVTAHGTVTVAAVPAASVSLRPGQSRRHRD